ncbi:YbjQ family protein [Granulicoccus sp. GXG6511]|uniref:YbjQ family protein n=1 Tax=Granulicoccus sp. GXG6511 TaxID=3381351 RepID=UPI003D7DFBA3
MLIVTTNGIPGYRIEAVLGEVMGMTVRSANLGSNIAAGLRSLGGGEMPELTKVVYDSRNEVMSRMWGECVRRGGNAVVGMVFDTSDLGKSFTEVCAYGTAVVVTPIPEGEPGATPQSIARAAAANPGPGNWPRMEQGVGAPVPAPDLGDGHRPGAGQQADASRDVAGAEDIPEQTVQSAGTAGESAQPGQMGESGHAGADDHSRRGPAGPDPRWRTDRPEEQRPNSGDSWLDLG